jgi:hypothetical protein
VKIFFANLTRKRFKGEEFGVKLKFCGSVWKKTGCGFTLNVGISQVLGLSFDKRMMS